LECRYLSTGEITFGEIPQWSLSSAWFIDDLERLTIVGGQFAEQRGIGCINESPNNREFSVYE
jgi:hypothetical protein